MSADGKVVNCGWTDERTFRVIDPEHGKVVVRVVVQSEWRELLDSVATRGAFALQIASSLMNTDYPFAEETE